jgi:hypothetical protein
MQIGGWLNFVLVHIMWMDRNEVKKEMKMRKIMMVMIIMIWHDVAVISINVTLCNISSHID